MHKKVVVISGSLRKGSNSEVLAKEFARGAEAMGHEVEVISLAEKNIGFCKGCLSCQRTGNCVILDDMTEIQEKVAQGQVLVFATPIYFYEMSGQMKTCLDRLNPLFAKDYNFREVYFIGAAADGSSSSMDLAIGGLEGFIRCFSKAKLAGVLRGTGLENPEDALAQGFAKYRKEAVALGEKV